MQQRLKLQQQQQQQQQQEAIMQQALLHHQQQQMYHPGVLAAAMSQMEPIPSGNLPPGFDPSQCNSVYVGNIHVNVTDKLLAEVFQSVGPLAGCKLIRKDKSSYGFIDYHDRHSAALAIMNLHGRQLDARVMWDHKTGRSKGYGFVSFREQQDAQSAINDLTGKWLGNRQIRCNWATKNAGSSEEKQSSDNQNAVMLTNGSSDGGQENSNEEAPENNQAYTTVYVGNLSHEVTQAELHSQFHALGAGVIEEVRVQRDKGFGFVRYNTHDEAALAIQIGNGRIVHGKSMKCSWGSKPTPAGIASNPLPPPVQPYQILPTAGINQGYSPADLMPYRRQLALNQAAATSLALNSGGSQPMYDAYPNSSSGHQLMYYR
ncbi:RNA-binding protein 208-like isoform X2 [Pyrus communis]|uniref:RNA-binding protein 208-like isoform X2 n=1 Tax=Pyrus communis TaxID=23211 RepID=UPI0035C0028A